MKEAHQTQLTHFNSKAKQSFLVCFLLPLCRSIQNTAAVLYLRASFSLNTTCRKLLLRLNILDLIFLNIFLLNVCQFKQACLLNKVTLELLRVNQRFPGLSEDSKKASLGSVEDGLCAIGIKCRHQKYSMLTREEHIEIGTAVTSFSHNLRYKSQSTQCVYKSAICCMCLSLETYTSRCLPSFFLLYFFLLLSSFQLLSYLTFI